jgi:uracil-DNA glycosylase
MSAVSRTNRDMYLREMGITPIWCSRDAQAENAVITQNEIAASTSMLLPPATHSPVANEHETTFDRATRIAQMSWDKLTADIARCTSCKLCKTRTKTVPGVGNKAPTWMIVGEAPGESEDKQGEPFVGRAGQLLDAMLAAVGKSRKQDVYITNVIKCRPPGNRNPEADEISACAPYLERQIELAKPKLLLAAGKFAGQQLLKTDATVGAMRAAPGKRNGVPVVVTYHPSYLLRSPLEKAKAWDDLATALSLTAPT